MRFLARVSAGLIVWAFGFLLLYAFHGLGCARGWHNVPMFGKTVFDWIMIATWIIPAIGCFAIARQALRVSSGFERRLAFSLAIAGLVGILITGAPVVIAAACV